MSIISVFNRLSDQLRFRFLGLGFYWAWIFTLFTTSLLFSFDVIPVFYNSVASVSSLIAFCLSLLGIVILKERIIGFLNDGRVLIPVAAVSVVGTLMLIVSLNNITFFFPMLITGAVLIGIGSGFLVVLWGYIYAQLSLQRIRIVAPISFAFATVVYFTVVGMPRICALITLVVLPIFSVIFLKQSSRDITIAYEQEKSLKIEQRRFSLQRLQTVLPLRFCLGVFLCSAAIGLVRGIVAPHMASLSGYYGFALAITGVVAFSISVIPAWLTRESQANFGIFFIVIPSIIISFLLIPLLGPGNPAANIPVTIGEFSLNILFWIILSSSAHKSPAYIYEIFSIGWLVINVGRLLGEILGGTWAQIFGSSSFSSSQFLLLSIIAIVMVLLATPLIFNERILVKAQTDNKDDLAVQIDGDAQSIDAETEKPLRCCQHLAERYGLTPRELEVLILLVKGRGIGYVQSRLSIAYGTAQAHKRGIYSKLGVHSREELFEMIDLQDNILS